MRLAVLFDHLGPYHLARLRAASRERSLLAVETRGRSREYAWDPSSEVEPFLRVTLFEDGETVSPEALGERLASALATFAPEVVAVPGWSGGAAFLAVAWACRHGVPVVVMSESTAYDEARSPWREAVKRRYLSLAGAALAGGSPHRDYLVTLGLERDAIFTGYDAVDNATFARESARWREADGPQPPCFLASNRFIPKKNLPRLLEAYSRHTASPSLTGVPIQPHPQSAIESPWPLVLLGDGEGKADLLARAEALGLAVIEGAPWERERFRDQGEEGPSLPTVYFPGFRQIEELPRFYAHAGAFVHASTTEQWGLVVNEAMACGLPVIVSNRCGCAPDLVKDGVNGWSFDPLDADALADLMDRVAALDDTERARLGESSREIIADWGPERFASGLKAAAEKALEVGPKRAGMIDRMLLKVLATR